MDYNTSIEACDNEVKVVVPSEESLLDQVRAANRSYGAPPPWAGFWPANSRVTADPVWASCDSETTTIQVICNLRE